MASSRLLVASLFVIACGSAPPVQPQSDPVAIPTEHAAFLVGQLLPPNTSVVVTLDVQRALESSHRDWALALVSALAEDMGGRSVAGLDTTLAQVERVLVPFERDSDDPAYIIAETAISVREVLTNVGAPVEECQDLDVSTIAPALGALRLSNGIRCGGDAVGVTINERFVLFGPEENVQLGLSRLSDPTWTPPTFPSAEGVRALAQVNSSAMVTMVGIHDEWTREAQGLQQAAGSIDFLDDLEVEFVAMHDSEQNAETTHQMMLQIHAALRGSTAMMAANWVDLAPEINAMQIARRGSDATFSLTVPGARVVEIVEAIAGQVSGGTTP